MTNRAVKWCDPWRRMGCICFIERSVNWSLPPMRRNPSSKKGLKRVTSESSGIRAAPLKRLKLWPEAVFLHLSDPMFVYFC
jgi:hypothetical protein